MIVFDASTLILLAKVDLLGPFLANAKAPAVIPEAVKDEVCIAGRQEGPIITRLLETKVIHAAKLKNRKPLPRLMADFSIDPGETEAIAIALEQGGTVATDDRNAIRACKMLGIKFITAISVLILLREKRIIARDEAVAKLDKLAFFARYSKRILEDAGKRLREE